MLLLKLYSQFITSIFNSIRTQTKELYKSLPSYSFLIFIIKTEQFETKITKKTIQNVFLNSKKAFFILVAQNQLLAN